MPLKSNAIKDGGGKGDGFYGFHGLKVVEKEKRIGTLAVSIPIALDAWPGIRTIRGIRKILGNSARNIVRIPG